MLNLKCCHLLLISGKRLNDFTIFFFLILNSKIAPRLYFLSKIWKIWIQKPPLDCLFWSRFLKEKKGFLIVHRVGARQQRLKEACGTKKSYPIWFLFLFLFLFHCHFFSFSFSFPFPFLFLFLPVFFFQHKWKLCNIGDKSKLVKSPNPTYLFLFVLFVVFFVCLFVCSSFFFFSAQMKLMHFWGPKTYKSS